ncbi:MAG TPA: alpha/beta fold hydrolase, partial [Actinomycetota bacterium]|nr:alpha/beta fold hydrolase [Actinomycetota bacterium]
MKARMLLIAAVLPAALLPGAARATAYERVDEMVEMSDEVYLEASVYYPPGTRDEKLPLVVRQHGGGSNKDNAYDVKYGLKFIDAGFALLMYSHRGHGNSQGIFDFFGPRTTKDFSEMLDWVEKTFASKIDTHRTAVSGYSQGGGESLLPAAHDARVKAASVGQTFADLNLALNPNDCFKTSWATGIFAAAYKVSASRTDDATAAKWGATWYSDTEDVGGPHVDSTTAHARAHSPIAYVDALNIPVFWAQAWEDQLFPGDHPAHILEPLRARGVPVHYWFSSGGHARGPNFPAEESARERAMLEWIDEHVRGTDHGFASRPLVDYWR